MAGEHEGRFREGSEGHGMSKNKLLPVKVWSNTTMRWDRYIIAWLEKLSPEHDPYMLVPIADYRAMKREVKQKDRVLRAVIRSAYLYQLGKLPAREDQIQLGRDLAIYGTLPVKPKKGRK